MEGLRETGSMAATRPREQIRGKRENGHPYVCANVEDVRVGAAKQLQQGNSIGFKLASDIAQIVVVSIDGKTLAGNNYRRKVHGCFPGF